MRLHLDPDSYDTCPPYNDWLDEQYSSLSGGLDILGFQPRPSLVLFTMSPDTYQATFDDFKQQREVDIEDFVCERFPSPIAYYFYRFKNGYENELQKLHFLRDTWEAVIDVLHSLAIAELRHRQIGMENPLKFPSLLTDSVAKRLENIEEISRQLRDAGIDSELSKIVSPGIIAAMKVLNQNRNAFSHGAAQSEAQARTWIAECYDDVLDVLEGLKGLQDVQIARYLGQPDVTTLRCETFKGHSAAKTFKTQPLTRQQLADSSRYFQQDHMLAVMGTEVFSLRPVVHFRDDANGHMTRLCMFRKTRGDAPDRTLEYAVVGEAASYVLNRTAFSPELTEIRRLFGLGDD